MNLQEGNLCQLWKAFLKKDHILVFFNLNISTVFTKCFAWRWAIWQVLLTTHSSVADCPFSEALITEFQAEYLLADRGYDTDAIIRCSLQAGMMPVIPPKKNRKVLRNYDKHIYKLRYLIENAFLHLKKWRSIATRYAKNVSSFVAAVQIRCIALWLKIY